MSFLSTLFGVDGEQERGNAIDAKLAELNRKKLAAGTWTPEQYETASRNLESGRVNVDKELNGAFVEGLKEGRGNIDRTVFGTIATILQSVPWFIWAGAFGFVFWWAGGFTWIARKTKGVLK